MLTSMMMFLTKFTFLDEQKNLTNKQGEANVIDTSSKRWVTEKK